MRLIVETRCWPQRARPWLPCLRGASRGGSATTASHRLRAAADPRDITNGLADRATQDGHRPRRAWRSIRCLRLRQHDQGDAVTMRSQLAAFFNLIDGRSPFDIESYRQRGEAMARQGLVRPRRSAPSSRHSGTWPGKRTRRADARAPGWQGPDTLPVYANINRATDPRTPAGFAAAARRAVADGFRAIKAAPWDGFPPPGSPDSGSHARWIPASRQWRPCARPSGSQIAIMVDCHSFFDVERAVARGRTARAVQPHVV